MIEKTGEVVEVKHTQDEDLEFWQGFNDKGVEIEYKSKRTHIVKKYDGEVLTEMHINGERVYCKEIVDGIIKNGDK
jgi:hypothetical protein